MCSMLGFIVYVQIQYSSQSALFCFSFSTSPEDADEKDVDREPLPLATDLRSSAGEAAPRSLKSSSIIAFSSSRESSPLESQKLMPFPL